MREIEKFVMTSEFSEKYGGIEAMLYVRMVKGLWKKYPVDMFIFENLKAGTLTISINGYHVETGKYYETQQICTTDSLPIDKFWLKVDDFGDEGGLIGTFLFPHEY